jgi:hypothetical protein
MIISNIIGGLGNQMFQYACGRALSTRLGCSLHLAVDQFKGYVLHSGYELERVFQIDSPLATEVELRSLLGLQASPKIRRLLGRPAMKNWCSEPFFNYWSGIDQVNERTYVHGYWQSEKYFKVQEDAIRDDFTFRMPWDPLDSAVAERMQNQPSASLHVRRGDYQLAKHKNIYATCDLKYYKDAIDLLRQRVPGVRFFAFTDDPDWVESNLKPAIGPLEVIRHNSGLRSPNDMRLMSAASHHIIANSSFSWWGAWLNRSPNKIVIAPRRWFLNGTNECDLIPPSWIRL